MIVVCLSALFYVCLLQLQIMISFKNVDLNSHQAVVEKTEPVVGKLFEISVFSVLAVSTGM